MDALYELKDKLCQELEEYGDKELSAGSLSTIDSLAHTIKNLDKIIETYEEDGYSEAYYDGSYEGTGNMGDGSYARRYSRERGGRGGSYAMARGDGRGRGSNAKRDSMGRYSRDGRMMAQELRDLMEDAPNEHIKMEMQKLIQKVENM